MLVDDFAAVTFVPFKTLDLREISHGVYYQHAVSQAEAEQAFSNEPLLIVEDVRHSSYEIRLHALGQTDAGRLLHISFTLRGNGKLIRVISARTMHRKERLRYEQEA
jgi:uncharacterized DUF497 family protein